MHLGAALWMTDGGRALDGRGGLGSYQLQPNFEYRVLESTERDRVREVSWSRGKEPRPSAKAPKDMLSVARMWKCPDSQQVGLEAATL